MKYIMLIYQGTALERQAALPERRLGRTDEARDAYRRARELTDDGAERRFLERRLTELAATTG